MASRLVLQGRWGRGTWSCNKAMSPTPEDDFDKLKTSTKLNSDPTGGNRAAQPDRKHIYSNDNSAVALFSCESYIGRQAPPVPVWCHTTVYVYVTSTVLTL